jgi:hypothetical protein
MWWDILPCYPDLDAPEVDPADAEVLDVMRRTLELDSEVCIQSALHGLGHWHYTHRGAQEIIDTFLAERGDELRPDLAEYAQAARIGMVQ